MSSATAFAIAVLREVEKLPPRLKLATAGVPAAWSLIAQLIPEMTFDIAPLPRQLSTRIGTNLVDLATPVVEPPIVPAT